MSQDHQKLLAAALRRKQSLAKRDCFDPFNLKSRPTPKQAEILKDVRSHHIYVVAGNQSGKSTMGGRVTAWKFEENHPYWERPNSHHCNLCRSEYFKEEEVSGIIRYTCRNCDHEWVNWGGEPLLLIVAGRVGTQLEELWEKKIKPYLTEGTYREKRVGSSIQEVIHKESGNKIIFTSHDKARAAAEKVQSFVAHDVWLDEMPSDHKYIEELHRRVDSRMGQFRATFTPKVRNERIRMMVDNVDPMVGIKYQLSKFDNPLFEGREEFEIAKLASLTEEERNCILYGSWLGAEDLVFTFLRSLHVDQLPCNYTSRWAHVASVDPAVRGLVGLVVAAQDPETKKWHIVKAKYVDGKAPSVLVKEIEREIRPYNVVRKIYDPHETWFMAEAVLQKQTYMGVYDKTGRKKDLISGVQQALLDQWLVFSPGLDEMFHELDTAEWESGRDDKIKNSTKYHLLDALQYLLDSLPSIPEPEQAMTRDAAIIAAFKEELKQKAEDAERPKPKIGGYHKARRSRWKRRRLW